MFPSIPHTNFKMKQQAILDWEQSLLQLHLTPLPKLAQSEPLLITAQGFFWVNSVFQLLHLMHIAVASSMELY